MIWMIGLITRFIPGFGKLSGLTQKLIIWAAIIAAAAWGIRLYTNRIYSQGKEAGRFEMSTEIIKAKQEEWAAKEKQLQVTAENLAAEKRSIEAAADQLSRDRANISRALSDGLTAIRQERTRQYANAAAVPDDRVWAELRAISEQLASDTR